MTDSEASAAPAERKNFAPVILFFAAIFACGIVFLITSGARIRDRAFYNNNDFEFARVVQSVPELTCATNGLNSGSSCSFPEDVTAWLGDREVNVCAIGEDVSYIAVDGVSRNNDIVYLANPEFQRYEEFQYSLGCGQVARCRQRLDGAWWLCSQIETQ